MKISKYTKEELPHDDLELTSDNVRTHFDSIDLNRPNDTLNILTHSNEKVRHVNKMLKTLVKYDEEKSKYTVMSLNPIMLKNLKKGVENFIIKQGNISKKNSSLQLPTNSLANKINKEKLIQKTTKSKFHNHSIYKSEDKMKKNFFSRIDKTKIYNKIHKNMQTLKSDKPEDKDILETIPLITMNNTLNTLPSSQSSASNIFQSRASKRQGSRISRKSKDHSSGRILSEGNANFLNLQENLNLNVKHNIQNMKSGFFITESTNCETKANVLTKIANAKLSHIIIPNANSSEKERFESKKEDGNFSTFYARDDFRNRTTYFNTFTCQNGKEKKYFFKPPSIQINSLPNEEEKNSPARKSKQLNLKYKNILTSEDESIYLKTHNFKSMKTEEDQSEQKTRPRTEKTKPVFKKRSFKQTCMIIESTNRATSEQLEKEIKNKMQNKKDSEMARNTLLNEEQNILISLTKRKPRQVLAGLHKTVSGMSNYIDKNKAEIINYTDNLSRMNDEVLFRNRNKYMRIYEDFVKKPEISCYLDEPLTIKMGTCNLSGINNNTIKMKKVLHSMNKKFKNLSIKGSIFK
jgi:hypothetical protein